jgi:hypothetical protein
MINVMTASMPTVTVTINAASAPLSIGGFWFVLYINFAVRKTFINVGNFEVIHKEV